MSSQTHPTDAVKYDNVRPTAEITLTDAEEAEFRKGQETLRKLLGDQKIVAKYKLEIAFGKARSILTNPTPGILSFWGNGSKLHGGGDAKLYICPGAYLKRSDCRAILQDDYNDTNGIVCPKCGTTWRHEEVIGEILLNLNMRKWSEVIRRYFVMFESHCDLYLKYHELDIRSVSKAQAAKATWAGTQVLDRTRAIRAKSIYPLRNMTRDINAGADLEKRIYAFLVA